MMKKNLKKFRKGYMDMLLLKVLSQGDYYGYEIILIFRKVSNDIINITAGSIYPVLYRLQDSGYITSYTKDEHSKMERIYYHITSEGEKALEEMIHDYALVTEAANAILNFTSDNHETHAV